MSGFLRGSTKAPDSGSSPARLAALRETPTEWRRGHLLGAAVALATLVVLTREVVVLDDPGYWSFYISGLLGGMTSLAELVSRYRDAPVVASISMPGLAYILVNVGAALCALYIVQKFHWDLGAGREHEQIAQIFLAGFGAAAVFRSSFLNVTCGEQRVSVGPYAVLHVILTAADRAVDRERALARTRHVRRAMRGISFEESADTLFTYTVATLQNLPPDEVASVTNKISFLRDSQNQRVPDSAKAQILGLSLMTLVGSKVLMQAAEHVRELQNERRTSGSTPHRVIRLPNDAGAPSRLSALIDVTLAQDEQIPLTILQQLLEARLGDFVPVMNARVKEGSLLVHGSPGAELVSRAPSGPGETPVTVDDHETV
ncbi:hypothetical protein GCM10022223_13190 [Kineosporia mesophila]|uniref:Uncharacterized protein n=1 Tax=Kineosporia mesophila TaxID=566012 RepID=A0ABP6Z777_9ACTN|nr:hypothetical protein [Kineosporia mesophila]MCD5354946.1 hypothetical protein [Kineosporia mesophila]